MDDVFIDNKCKRLVYRYTWMNYCTMAHYRAVTWSGSFKSTFRITYMPWPTWCVCRLPGKINKGYMMHAHCRAQCHMSQDWCMLPDQSALSIHARINGEQILRISPWCSGSDSCPECERFNPRRQQSRNFPLIFPHFLPQEFKEKNIPEALGLLEGSRFEKW